MKAALSERNIVIALFITVLITFSLAQEDTREMEKIQTGISASTASGLLIVHQAPARVIPIAE